MRRNECGFSVTVDAILDHSMRAKNCAETYTKN